MLQFEAEENSSHPYFLSFCFIAFLIVKVNRTYHLHDKKLCKEMSELKFCGISV